MKSQKPVIFLYGGDDFWTGAAIEDQYVNNTTVKKHILEAQKHDCSISAITDADYETISKDDLWKEVDYAILGTEKPTPITTPAAARNEYADARKVVRNGIITIHRNNAEYTLTGERITK